MPGSSFGSARATSSASASPCRTRRSRKLPAHGGARRIEEGEAGTSGTRTVGEAMIDLLEANGVEVVFGIPGVHTVELYRGLAASRIRHITPRHEQGAGFMADGYARVTGKPGVALGHHRAGTDQHHHRHGAGAAGFGAHACHIRRQPRGLLARPGPRPPARVARPVGDDEEASPLASPHPDRPGRTAPRSIAQAFAVMGSARPGRCISRSRRTSCRCRPATIALKPILPAPPGADQRATLRAALRRCATSARRIVLMCGGGAASDCDAVHGPGGEARRRAGGAHRKCAGPTRRPSTARAGQPEPRRPSRALVGAADLVIALGTEMGQTDYDMYADGGFPALPSFIRRRHRRAATLARAACRPCRAFDGGGGGRAPAAAGRCA